MLNNDFFHDGLKKATVLFGTLFNEIHITRKKADDSSIETITVPIEYGPREKALSRVENDPELNRVYAILLPRMTYEMTGIEYDTNRKLNTTQRYNTRETIDNKNVYKSVFVEAPYTLTFTLSILSKSIRDGNVIVEQILPYFTPDWTVRATLLEDQPDRIFNVPVILESIEHEDTYENDYTERRAIIWTLTFKMHYVFFGPVDKAKVIKVADINFITDYTPNILDE